MDALYVLRPQVQHYAWGSPTAIPELLGSPGDGRPVAELWFGAHPSGPSEVEVAGQWRPLGALLADDAPDLLGREVLDRFGPRLPYLLKLLAAAEPLSLQVHPTLAQAREGYVREEAAGTPRRAPHRTYPDRNHKPELLVALTPFEALTGFRSPLASAELFAAFGAEGASELRRWASRLVDGDLAATFWGLWELEGDACRQVVAQLGKAGARLAAHGGPWQNEGRWASRLAEAYPDDPGVVVAQLLNLVRLEPGEGLYAPAGRLHAYLGGLAVEIMAASDNVIRAGLTAKHVDLAELEHVLAIRPEVVTPLQPEPAGPGGEEVYPTPAGDFRLSRFSVGDGASVTVAAFGPEIVLCLAGSVSVAGRRLQPGMAVLVGASCDAYVLEGPGTAWRATVGEDR